MKQVSESDWKLFQKRLARGPKDKLFDTVLRTCQIRETWNRTAALSAEQYTKHPNRMLQINGHF